MRRINYSRKTGRNGVDNYLTALRREKERLKNGCSSYWEREV